MNCRQVQRKLQFMLDGRLGAAGVKEVAGQPGRLYWL